MGKIQEAQDQYVMALTDEAIEEMAKGGQNVDMLYKHREEARKRHEEKMKNEVHLERLDEYKNTPRDPKTAFAKKAIKTGMFGSNGNTVDAPLVYGAVVQAQSSLWKPFRNNNSGMVVVFTLDEKYKYDIEWLTQMANKISETKKEEVDQDMQTIKENLLNTRSIFCNKVGKSMAGDVEVWCGTYIVKDTKMLPKMFIPNNKILPFLVTEELKDGNKVFTTGSPFKLINKEFYE